MTKEQLQGLVIENFIIPNQATNIVIPHFHDDFDW